MTANVYLLVESKGWPTSLDPEVLSVILQSCLDIPLPSDIRTRSASERWFEELPSDECVVCVLITQTPPAGWQAIIRSWLSTIHRLYVLYTDGVDAGTVRDLASITALQPLARAPYRIAQQNGTGLKHPMRCTREILEHLLQSPPLP